MAQPLCFTCRIRDQVVRLGEGRATVTGPHELADPVCDLHATSHRSAGRPVLLSGASLTTAALR